MYLSLEARSKRNDHVIEMLKEFEIVVERVPSKEAFNSNKQVIFILPRKGELKLATKEYKDAVIDKRI